jgi:hypothetical protein
MKEKGTDSIANVEGIQVLKVLSTDDVEGIYWYLKSGNAPFKTIALDTVTQLQAFAIEKALKDAGKEVGVDGPSKRDFGATAGWMNTWLINYRDLVDEQINVVFTAHDRVTTNDDFTDGDIEPQVGPRLMPSVASTLNGIVSVIGQTFIREEIHKGLGKQPTTREVHYGIRLAPHSYYITKIRQPKGFYLPEYLYDPTYEKILELMKKGGSKPEPKVLAKPVLRRA